MGEIQQLIILEFSDALHMLMLQMRSGRNLMTRLKMCFFFGVSESFKAYKLFNPLTKKIVISKDVVFDEENTWDWNRSNEQEQFSAPYTQENSSDSVTTTTTSPTVVVVNEETTHSVRRVRRRPAWMEDYEVTGIEDPITHFSLFSDCDPPSFQSVVKEEKWRKAIDNKIDAIERNDT